MKIQNSFLSTVRGMLLVTILVTSLGFAGCSSAKKAEGEDAPASAPSVDDNTMGDSDTGRALGLQTVNFGYDSFVLEEGEKSKLQANADIMKNNAGLKVQIEGHCDQRGGIQYNIALGEKRANAVKRFLEGMGVAGDRLTTISYGKERPIDPGSTEAAFSKNRRANFAVTAK